MTYILGINAYHADSAACLLRHGKLIAAAEEERFKRIKHWAGFPEEAIRWCLHDANMTLSDVAHVAINTDPRANVMKKIAYTVRHRPSCSFILDRIKNKKARITIGTELTRACPGHTFDGRVHYVEHHLAHLASAHFASPFKNSLAVSVDGFGDFSSAAWGPCIGHALKVRHRVYFPHSLGIFYQGMTQYLGFSHYGDEYKVMGLAPYGKPTYLQQMRDIVHTHSDGTFTLDLQFFRHHQDNVAYEWSGGSPVVGGLYRSQELEHLLGFPARQESHALEQCHRDLAHSVQARYEEVFLHLLATAHHRYGIDELTLAGGCAMNSVANGKIYRKSPFKNVYVQAAAGDAGGAIGAAYIVATQHGETQQRQSMNHAYLGPSYTDVHYGQLLKEKKSDLDQARCSVTRIEHEEELCQKTAQALCDGLIVGWFQGAMEWGPRALGNRSILGDPRRTDMKEILNSKIKRRESFRPFAPSILRHRVHEWFEEDHDVPFMMQVFQIKQDQRDKVPAVAHVDGSGRLQTVSETYNPRYYRLIEAFEQLTSVPMVLNTSFNENEPVVCSPEEALACFLRTQMDVLVLGDWLVTRNINALRAVPVPPK